MRKTKSSPKPSADDSKLNDSSEKNKLPTHIAIYSGGMDNTAGKFLDWCLMPAGEDADCIIILSTLGGGPDIAYRISRALQKKYKRVRIAIPFMCKSAGTLLCIGAHALMFGKRGELGPLDIQVPKKDELVGSSSVLTPLHALSALRDEGFACFCKYFLSTFQIGRGQISTTKAAQIASDLTVKLLGNVYSQIDPMLLGQTTRDVSIAREYGLRLNNIAKNLQQGALRQLIMAYPQHGFVIDEEEARELFVHILSIPEAIEEIVAEHRLKIQKALEGGESFFCVIQENYAKPVEASDEKNGGDSNSERNNGAKPKKQTATTGDGHSA